MLDTESSGLDALKSSDRLNERGEPIYILYIGRKLALAKKIHAALDAEQMTAAQIRPLHFVTITSQKAATDFLRDPPPNIVLVELDNKSSSRVRFCDMLRYRLPAATILALSAPNIERPFEFDGVIHLPLVLTQALDVINIGMNDTRQYQLSYGHIQLDLASRSVSTQNGVYHMTPKQCALLNMLMLNHNQVVRRVDIMKEIWETSFMDDTRTLDVHIRWLRERIEPEPSNPIYLMTVRGVGYRLCLE